MVTAAVVAACVVLVACGVSLLWLRRARADADRRLDEVLGHLDGHLQAMSASVARAVDAVVDSGARRPLPPLTLDFDELVDSLVEETAARTGADAVVLRVEGPGGRPVVASLGRGVESETLDRPFGPPGAAHFDAVAIDWTYSAAGDPADAQFRSALVTPLGPTTSLRGVVAAYAFAADAFRPEHAEAVKELMRDAAVALSNARRFAEVETRVNIDPATGIRNRRGYELELGREVARAERSGRPLSVVLVDVEEDGETGSTARDSTVAAVARVVSRTTRRGDISCRRSERELAILLPGTEETGATVLTKRLRDAATHTLGSSPSTVTVGLVERLPAESAEALDTRIDSALGRSLGATVSTLEEVRNASTAGVSTVRSTLASGSDLVRPATSDALRRDAVDALERELADARGFGRALAIVALEVEGVDRVSEQLGREAADAALGQFTGRLDRSLGTGSVHRLATTVFALVLPGSGVDDAEALVDALQTSLEPPHDETGLVLSAGITELGDEDDAEAGLGRAEHSLWQARQAGPGTVVVAVPNRRRKPPP
jgi:diguanylate cyclase (GGDEF)-like protein